jgi:hypothetical protein
MGELGETGNIHGDNKFMHFDWQTSKEERSRWGDDIKMVSQDINYGDISSSEPV